MIERARPSQVVPTGIEQSGQPYLSTQRALSACTRELARLSEAITQYMADLPDDGMEDEVVLRQSPGRCIVQFGPVALTITWLRRTPDSVAAGELLVIVWRGMVAPALSLQPERRLAGPPPLAATALWERVFTAAAESEADWTWRSIGPQKGESSSEEVALAAVKRLRAAYRECRTVA